MTTKKDLAEIKEQGVLEFVENLEKMVIEEDINEDIIESLYEDEEVKRLTVYLTELKKEVKSIEATMKKVDKLAMEALSRRGVKKAETSTLKISLVEYIKYSIDDQKLETFLSQHGKSKTEFQKEQEVRYLKKTVKKE